MAAFLTPLDSRRVGVGRRKLLSALVYSSDILDTYITVPEGFEYDGASIPWWIPAAYTALRERCEAASAIHDKLYQDGSVTRSQADAVFREALEADGVNVFFRNLAWLGVRVGGGIAWGRHRTDVDDFDASNPDHSPGA